MMNFSKNTICTSLAFMALLAGGSSPFLSANQLELPTFNSNFTKNKNTMQIVVNNRPLVKIHGKIITVLDVKKKMDLFLQENHPEALASTTLCYQYYVQNWRHTLQEAINIELMKMEAEELEYKIPDGDISQEMDRRWGPNVLNTIDKYGLTLDEARSIAYDDHLARILSWYRVWARTNQLISPDAIKKAYEDHVASIQLNDGLGYQILTVRGGDTKDTETASKDVHNYLVAHPESKFSDVVAAVEGTLPAGVSLSVSQTYESKTKDLSREYASILERLPVKAFSDPVQLVSRVDGSTSFRIFQLMDVIKSEPPKFEDLADALKGRLFEEIGSKQREEYLLKLRKRFYCEDLVVSKLFPASYQPFSVI